MNDTDFESKVLLITGGDTGIGRATVDAFSSRRCKIIIGNRDRDRGESVAREVTSRGGFACFEQIDVSNEADVCQLVARAVHEFGKIDFAFNNAGILGPKLPLHEQNDSIYEDVFATNVKGLFLSLKHEISHMMESGGGVIVNNASNLGLRPVPGLSLYAASKAAVCSLTKVAAAECAPHHIRVNCVAPGPIDTQMLDLATCGAPHSLAAAVPMGRIGTPEEVAETVVWLCSSAASFVTGHVLTVDGGASL